MDTDGSEATGPVRPANRVAKYFNARDGGHDVRVIGSILLAVAFVGVGLILLGAVGAVVSFGVKVGWGR
jgi:hypothetical protein